MQAIRLPEPHCQGWDKITRRVPCDSTHQESYTLRLFYFRPNSSCTRVFRPTWCFIRKRNWLPTVEGGEIAHKVTGGSSRRIGGARTPAHHAVWHRSPEQWLPTPLASPTRVFPVRSASPIPGGQRWEKRWGRGGSPFPQQRPHPRSLRVGVRAGAVPRPLPTSRQEALS